MLNATQESAPHHHMANQQCVRSAISLLREAVYAPEREGAVAFFRSVLQAVRFRSAVSTL